MEEESLSQRAKDALQGVANLEQSRDHVEFHLLSLALTFDANLNLLRLRQAVVVNMELQQHLAQATYQLPFKPSSSRLFGERI